MAFDRPHEIYKRRFGRNLGVSLMLAALVALTFALTVVKVTRGDPMQGYDHVIQPQSVPMEKTE